MHVLLLNQYFPPDPAPTGVLLSELAERLRADGHTTEFIDSGAAYRASQAQAGRARRELAALGRMLWRGLRARRPDVVVSATSPPLLLVVATMVALRHRARSVHWAMDLYPELALTLGEIRPGLLSRTCEALMGWCYRRAHSVTALDADMASHLLLRYRCAASTLQPWVFAPVVRELQQALARGSVLDQRSEPWTWIYSGNLGRAHEWETLLEAQKIIESRDSSIRLLFQGGGPAWPAARARAEQLGLRRCEWRGYVAEAELPASLLQHSVCVATQRPEARGLLWPSKLGLLLALPRPVLWIGDTNGAIAREFPTGDGSGRAGVFAPGQAQEIAEWLLAVRAANPQITPARRPAELRQKALEWWSQLFHGWAEA